MKTARTVSRLYLGVRIRDRVRSRGAGVSYRVECPTAWFGRRKVFRQFKSLAMAKGFIETELTRRRQLGSLALALTPAQAEDAAAAIQGLKGVGVSLLECVEFYLRHHRPPAGDIRTRDLVARLIEDRKRGRGGKGHPLRPRSLDDLRLRLEGFCRCFGGVLVKDIEPHAIEEWLYGNDWANQTRLNSLRVLNVFFGYAVKAGYRSASPMPGVTRPRPDERAPGILSVDECERLLRATLEAENEAGTLGHVVLGMFCGIRTAELARLDWSAVDLKRKLVTIGPEIAKTRGIRNVDIPDNAIPWLLRCRRRTGPVDPEPLRGPLERIRARAAITQWPPNALRHTAASHHYGLHRDAQKTAAMMGHRTDAMLFAHYRALVTPDEAERFFALRPPDQITPSILPMH